mmetsp:Transcript_2218/g.5858  ORF Transcript_2218/g.5858 Transcript_2218/m.5858 type:complete len:87 (+) Transcript_2218:379-639(+)
MTSKHDNFYFSRTLAGSWKEWISGRSAHVMDGGEGKFRRTVSELAQCFESLLVFFVFPTTPSCTYPVPDRCDNFPLFPSTSSECTQ